MAARPAVSNRADYWIRTQTRTHTHAHTQHMGSNWSPVVRRHWWRVLDGIISPAVLSHPWRSEAHLALKKLTELFFSFFLFFSPPQNDKSAFPILPFLGSSVNTPKQRKTTTLDAVIWSVSAACAFSLHPILAAGRMIRRVRFILSLWSDRGQKSALETGHMLQEWTLTLHLWYKPVTCRPLSARRRHYSVLSVYPGLCLQPQTDMWLLVTVPKEKNVWKRS